MLMLFLDKRVTLSEAVRLEPVMLTLLLDTRSTEPEELMLEDRLVTVSVMRVPPFLELPHEISSLL